MSLLKQHTLRFFRQTCFPVTLLTGEIAFTLCDAEDFPWDAHPLQEFHEQYRTRFAEDTRAFVGRSCDTVVFSCWVQQHRLSIDELRWEWQLGSAEAVAFDVVTMPEWRGKGIYPDALRRLCGVLAEEGVRHLWIYAEEDNAASLRGIRKAGFEEHGVISATHLAGLTRRSGVVKGVNG